jgi:hypothetical protein
MTRPRLRSSPALFLPFFLALAAPRAQQGLELGKMWTFDNPPLAYLEAEYGFKPTAEWFEAVRLAALRYGKGCSASFVSPRGLIMTNHHCAREDLDKVSPKGQDWGRNGFYATSLEGEVKVPDLTVQQLVSIKDVTKEMNTDLPAGADDAAIDSKLESNRQKILDAARQADAALKPEIVTLYNGAIYQLYSYKVYDDIRLVCAPHLEAAYFGGDPDNFTYPRYCFDFTFLRAYEGGKPADTSGHYYRWSRSGPHDGELVFTVGNPGSTGRLDTVARLEFLRDVYYPFLLEMLDGFMSALRGYAQTGADAEQEVRSELFGLSNTHKAFTGYLAGLLDEGRMARKRKAEAAFKSAVQAQPAARDKFGTAWDELAKVAEKKRTLELKTRLQQLGFNSQQPFSKHLALADRIVRAVHPESSTDRRKTAREQALGFDMAESEKDKGTFPALFADHMARAEKWLGKDDPFVKAVLGGRSAQDVLQHLRATSKLGDKATTEQLLQGGMDAVNASADPAIVIARTVVPMAIQNSREMNALNVSERVHGARIGQALFAAYGSKVSPDATFTLRFSDGLVKGYDYNGTVAPWKTSMFGLFARNTEFDGKSPFDLPNRWLERQSSLDLRTAVNFVSTNDIIGGNSGSPIINVKREVVGLIFDGNIEQLPNRFLYDEATARSVSVHVHGLIEALRKVYDAGPLADELLGSTDD